MFNLKNSVKWYLKQLLPLKYESNYGVEGERYHITWRMWFGKCFHSQRELIESKEDEECFDDEEYFDTDCENCSCCGVNSLNEVEKVDPSILHGKTANVVFFDEACTCEPNNLTTYGLDEKQEVDEIQGKDEVSD